LCYAIAIDNLHVLMNPRARYRRERGLDRRNHLFK
jgi:hypothetical protein